MFLKRTSVRSLLVMVGSKVTGKREVVQVYSNIVQENGPQMQITLV
jgi:hypothetical protein